MWLQKIIARLNKIYGGNEQTGLDENSSEADVDNFLEGVEEAPTVELSQGVIDQINQSVAASQAEAITTAVTSAITAHFEANPSEGVTVEAMGTAISKALEPVNKSIEDNHTAALKAVNDAKLTPTGQAASGDVAPPSKKKIEGDEGNTVQKVTLDELMGSGELVSLI